MEIFINEISLAGQYASEAEFQTAIQEFNSIFFLINKRIKEKKIYKGSQLFVNRNAIRESNFHVSLNSLKEKSLKTAFINIIFNKLHPKEWCNEQVHSDSDLYVHQIDFMDVTGTSVAEVAERSLQNNESIYLLINFKSSSFQCPHPQIASCFLAPISKNLNEENLINIDCLDSKSSFEVWLEQKLQLSHFEYPSSSSNPPMDRQTVLRDEVTFKKTQMRCQSRAVYLEINANRYWCVDNLHGGKAAHLEVFDSIGKHIGESNLLGDIDFSKKDNNKYIDL